MARWTIAHRPDADTTMIVAALQAIDASIMPTGRIGKHRNQMRGSFPVFEIRGPKGLDEMVFNAQHSSFWEGPDVREALDGYDDMFAGPIGAQRRRLNRAFGQGPDPSQATKTMIGHAMRSDGQIVLVDSWMPTIQERYFLVPRDQVDAVKDMLAPSFEADNTAAQALCDRLWAADKRLPRPWEARFDQAVAEDSLSVRAREVFLFYCSFHIEPSELMAGVRDLDDGRSLVVFAPVAHPEWTGSMERILERFFADEDPIGTQGRGVLGEPHEVEAALGKAQFTLAPLEALLDRAMDEEATEIRDPDAKMVQAEANGQRLLDKLAA